MEEQKQINVAFAAFQPSVVANIPSYKENENKSKDIVSLGNDDAYANFLWDIYLNCTDLQTIINGTSDFAVGNGIRCNVPGFEKSLNNRGESANYVLGRAFTDYFLYGACYFEVIRNKGGKPGEIYWLDYRYVRTNKKNTVFYYNENYGQKYGRTGDALIFPKFMPDATASTSVVMVKNPYSRSVYGTPVWVSSLRSVLTEIEIDKYHLNEICNNFVGSAIINFNSGTPTDEQKKEIEKNISEKFTGSENAGRFVLSFNNGRVNETTIQRIATDDFADRYNALSEQSRSRVFSAFGASPNLFGVPTDNKGFTEEQYEESFRLYNRTRVRPVQIRMSDTFDYIFGVEGSLTIDPFSVNEGNNDEETNVQ